jgi:hypothetical protein
LVSHDTHAVPVAQVSGAEEHAAKMIEQANAKPMEDRMRKLLRDPRCSRDASYFQGDFAPRCVTGDASTSARQRRL